MQTVTVAEQLVEIYEKEEHWHQTRMGHQEAIDYHQQRLDNGSIYPYIEDGEVLGYYERYFYHNVCFLCNVWVKQEQRQGKVFKELYRHFFSTMPTNITKIMGEKQKINMPWKWQQVSIRKGK